MCHPNADSYRDLTPTQIYKKHENEKKRQYAERVMEIEQGTFTPLVFRTTGGMADECVNYHSRLAALIANKKGESYSSAISWITAKVSFATVRSAILCPLKLFLSSKLHGRNKVMAVNIWAVAVLRYRAGVLKWTTEELKDLD